MSAKMLHEYVSDKKSYNVWVRVANIFVACFIALLIWEIIPLEREWWRTMIIAASAIGSDKILDFIVANWAEIVMQKVWLKK